MKDMENFIRGSLDKELRRAEGIHSLTFEQITIAGFIPHKNPVKYPRSTTALAKGEGQQARVALVKLQKDFERARSGIQGVMRDAQAIEVSE